MVCEEREKEVVIEVAYWEKGDFYGRSCTFAIIFVADLQLHSGHKLSMDRLDP